MAAFSELGVMPEVVKAIEEIDWLLPTNIQAEAIPLILGGGDVLMAAETGSGKTGAFCLPVLQIVHETLRDRLEGKGEKQPSKGGMDEVLLNPYDRDPDLAISPDGLLCQSRDQRKWNGCRSSLGVMSGKHYFEATVTDEGLCRVGWATSAATLELGKDKFGFGFGGTGKKSFSGQFDDYGEPFGINDTIGIMIDLENHTISFAKNGNSLGKAFTIPEALHGEVFFAAVTLKNAEMKFNFGASPFSGQPPPGYEALSSAKDLKAAKRKTKNQSGKNQRLPLALIVEPARELAQQTSDNIKQFGRHLTNPTLKSCLLIGGDRAKEQLKWLREGIDIVTGTPGKLDDMMTTGCLDLSEVSFFILDEVDGLLSGGHGQFIQKIFQQLPKVSSAGRRLQMIVCSATLHSLDVKKLADRLMYHPIWIDLKGQDSVPETVHHVVCKVDPVMDTQWHTLKKHIATDGIHQRDTVRPGMKSKEALSEGVKILKGQYLLQAITKHEMDQAIIFCRTKLDCDNVEKYLISLDGGKTFMCNKSVIAIAYSCTSELNCTILPGF
jgi:ATP-dependent RNA helicase DDX1